MFFHNFKYAVKTLFQNKTLLFWTFAFPIILGTLFQMAFQDIESSETLDTIDIAIIENHENDVLKNILEEISIGDKKLFSITYEPLKEAEKLLEDQKISGYFILSENIKLVIKENGIDQTILKTVTEEILEKEDIIQKLATSFDLKDQYYQDLYNKIKQKGEAKQIVDISSRNLSYTMIEFYTLIAMTCLYGGILGLTVMNQNLANQSSNGKRITVSPASKKTIIFSSALAGYIVQLIGISLLFLYTIFVLHIDYGNHLYHILELTLMGCFAGLSLGIMIGSLLKASENTKTGIVIAITMLGCFLSGMMGITMKYIVDKNVPILNLVNPASMITDGFYSLYYYETLDRYYFDFICLFIFSIVMILLSIRSLRRQTYDSI